CHLPVRRELFRCYRPCSAPTDCRSKLMEAKAFFDGIGAEANDSPCFYPASRSASPCGADENGAGAALERMHGPHGVLEKLSERREIGVRAADEDADPLGLRRPPRAAGKRRKGCRAARLGDDRGFGPEPALRRG